MFFELENLIPGCCKNFETNDNFNRILVIIQVGTVIKVVFVILSWALLYGVTIWTYLNPKESLLWGRRGIYKEEPEITERAIQNTKKKALITIIIFPIMSILFFLSIYIL